MQVTTSDGERVWLGGWSAGPLWLRGSGDRTYWSMIDKVLWSRSLIEPCSAWGRNVVSTTLSST